MTKTEQGPLSPDHLSSSPSPTKFEQKREKHRLIVGPCYPRVIRKPAPPYGAGLRQCRSDNDDDHHGWPYSGLSSGSSGDSNAKSSGGGGSSSRDSSKQGAVADMMEVHPAQARSLSRWCWPLPHYQEHEIVTIYSRGSHSHENDQHISYFVVALPLLARIVVPLLFAGQGGGQGNVGR